MYDVLVCCAYLLCLSAVLRCACLLCLFAVFVCCACLDVLVCCACLLCLSALYAVLVCYACHAGCACLMCRLCLSCCACLLCLLCLSAVLVCCHRSTYHTCCAAAAPACHSPRWPRPSQQHTPLIRQPLRPSTPTSGAGHETPVMRLFKADLHHQALLVSQPAPHAPIHLPASACSLACFLPNSNPCHDVLTYVHYSPFVVLLPSTWCYCPHCGAVLAVVVQSYVHHRDFVLTVVVLSSPVLTAVVLSSPWSCPHRCLPDSQWSFCLHHCPPAFIAEFICPVLPVLTVVVPSSPVLTRAVLASSVAIQPARPHRGHGRGRGRPIPPRAPPPRRRHAAAHRLPVSGRRTALLPHAPGGARGRRERALPPAAVRRVPLAHHEVRQENAALAAGEWPRHADNVR